MVAIRVSAFLLAAAMTLSQAVAAPVTVNATPKANASAPRQPSPLPAGRAASISEAQGVGRPLLYWAAAGGAIIAGVILISQDGDDDNTTTTTTSTGP